MCDSHIPGLPNVEQGVASFGLFRNECPEIRSCPGFP